MPIYRFRCDNCEHEFETLIIRKEDWMKETQCPECANEKITKMIGGTSFRLKGGGWAKDGYKGGGKR